MIHDIPGEDTGTLQSLFMILTGLEVAVPVVSAMHLIVSIDGVRRVVS